MKTNNKLSAYILRGGTAVLLFSCVIVALCSAINLPEQSANAISPQDNAAFGANAHQNRILSFADRVAYQWAVEDVYWRHRIWPNTNPGPKPSLDAVMSHAQIEKKVTDYLRNSQTLEAYWQRPITAEQLQTEMERVANDTKQPEVLRELFQALGNDPFVIAECLARPALAERLAAGITVVAGVSPASTNLLAAPNAFGAASTGNRLRAANRGVISYTLPEIADPSGGCIDDTWAATTLTNAPTPRIFHTAVWTGSEMIVWGGQATGPYLNTGGRYNPSTHSWTPTSLTDVPEARSDGHTAVWTGSEMIVWGGNFLNTGGRYNPGTDTWTATSLTDVPSGRGRHTAVWTGSEMIVWGGSGLDTGGRYNPNTDSWRATSTINAPSGRAYHTAVLAGSEMIVWGGDDTITFFDTGGRYDPLTNSWTATSLTNPPAARSVHTAAWTGTEMIVWGGYDGGFLNTGGRYDPIADSWTATSTTNEPETRFYHTAVWTGIEMIVWAGESDNFALFNTGGRYDPNTDSWTATSLTDAPEARSGHTAVWGGSEMIVWGGGDRNGFDRFNTGGRYCAAAPSPTPRPQPTPRPRPTPVPRP